MIAAAVFLALAAAFVFAVGRAALPRCARAPLHTYRTRDVGELAVLGARRFAELGRRYSPREPGGTPY